VEKQQENPIMKVVAAVIEKDGRVLIARRREETSFGGYWEFPGGKVEDDESPEIALAREILEEMGVKIQVKDLLQSVAYHHPPVSLELLAYRADLVTHDFKLIDHDEIRWAAPSDLAEEEFTAPDRPIVRRLAGPR
jgi:8-oxo-dGTP diphosphatase